MNVEEEAAPITTLVAMRKVLPAERVGQEIVS
jgi:hypothetical protein